MGPLETQDIIPLALSLSCLSVHVNHGSGSGQTSHALAGFLFTSSCYPLTLQTVKWTVSLDAVPAVRATGQMIAGNDKQRRKDKLDWITLLTYVQRHMEPYKPNSRTAASYS